MNDTPIAAETARVTAIRAIDNDPGAAYAMQRQRDTHTALLAQLQEQIAAAQDRYERHGDPYAPWIAYRVARIARLAIPEWVLSHFDRAADGMKMATLGAPWPETKEDGRPAVVLEALGFKFPGRGGRGTPLTRALRRLIDEEIAQAIDAAPSKKAVKLELGKPRTIERRAAEGRKRGTSKSR